MRFAILLSAFLAAACGGESTSDGNSGGSPSGGTAGSTTGGSGGSGGSSTGGSAGVSGNGGVSASGVLGECKVDADCELKASCCECLAGRTGSVELGPCDAALCESDQCAVLGVSQARCIAGQCTIAANCDINTAICKSLPPKCPAGTTATVAAGGCWGPCLPHTSCEKVEDCFACPTGTICIVNSAWESSHHCVNPNPNCGGGCECLAPLACIEPFTACGELDDGSAAHCECPTC